MTRCLSCMNLYDSPTPVCPHCGYEQHTPPREGYHLSPGNVLEGHYLVGRVLGYGGFGVTYIGYDQKLERTVAIKEFLPTTFATRLPGDTHLTVYNNGNVSQQFDAGLNRFVDEAQTLAQFNGVPGIVDIYDTFMGNNTAYIVMGFLKGHDVKHILTNQGALNFEMARGIILRVCDTLAVVHAKNIIHRDISPDNIFITDDGDIKLLDFGAARYESAVNSKSLSVILKSGYAPEEQYRSKGDQGPWTDVYALAATFYKLLTGQTPPDSMERAIADEIVEPSKLDVKIPQSAENALMNALNVRKGDRTQSVTEFAAALKGNDVQRVKVKVRRDSTKAPLAAKIAIAVSAVILVGFGIFAATGGLAGEEATPIVVGGTMLEDNFGSAQTEGFAMVPNVEGMSYDEAVVALEEVGLGINVARVDINVENYAAMEDMTVTEQLDTAGAQLEEGQTANVALFVKDFELATQMGIVQDITQMSTSEAIGYAEATFDHMNIVFEYSDTVPHSVPIGYKATYDTETNEQFDTRLHISAGTQAAQGEPGNIIYGYATSRHADQFEITVVTAMEPPEQSSDSERAHVLYASTDGGTTWEYVSYMSDSFTSYSNYGSDNINYYHISSNYITNLNTEQYFNKELRLMVETRLLSEDGTRVEEQELTYDFVMSTPIVDSFVLENTFTLQPREADYGVEVTNIERITEQEMRSVAQDNEFENMQSLQNTLEYNIYTDTHFYKLTGDFTSGESYPQYHYSLGVIYNDSMNSDYTEMYFLADESGAYTTAYLISDMPITAVVFVLDAYRDNEPVTDRQNITVSIDPQFVFPVTAAPPNPEGMPTTLDEEFMSVLREELANADYSTEELMEYFAGYSDEELEEYFAGYSREQLVEYFAEQLAITEEEN